MGKTKKLKRQYREAKNWLRDLEKRDHRGMDIGAREFRLAQDEVARTGRKLDRHHTKKALKKRKPGRVRIAGWGLYGASEFGGSEAI